MESYREQSKKRYIAHKELEDLKEEEKKRTERELSDFYELLEKWDNIKTRSIEDVEAIYSLFSMAFLIAKKHDLFFHIEKRVIGLVESLNDIFTNKKLSSQEIRPFFEIMNLMIGESGLEIPIEIMDTEKDEEIANQLLTEEYQKPICSFTSKVGLKLTELKDIARLHNLQVSGKKEDLCRRLYEYDLVRIL